MGHAKRTPEQVEADLRELVREANAAIKDLRNELRDSIFNQVETQVNAAINEANRQLSDHIKNFGKDLTNHYNGLQDALTKRMNHIAAMNAVDKDTSALIAAAFIRDNGGSVDLSDGRKVHLLLEQDDPSGARSFHFGEGAGQELTGSFETMKQISDAIAEHRTEFEHFTVAGPEFRIELEENA